MDKETLEKHAGGFLDNLKGMDGSSITGLFDKLKEKGTDLKDHMPALEGLVKSGDLKTIIATVNYRNHYDSQSQQPL